MPDPRLDWNRIRTHSGDIYFIIAERYDEEVRKYREAIQQKNWDYVLLCETGQTGWVYEPYFEEFITERLRRVLFERAHKGITFTGELDEYQNPIFDDYHETLYRLSHQKGEL